MRLGDKFERIFRVAREVPYRIPLTIHEKNESCVGKHFLIMDALESLGYQVRWAEGTFRWSDLPLPQEILLLPHDDDTSHAWLEVEIDGVWQAIDATWDSGLASTLPINEASDLNHMQIAVPVLRKLSPDEIHIFRETPPEYAHEFERNREFYSALNDWFAYLRSQ